MLDRGVRVGHARCLSEAGKLVDIAAGQRLGGPGVEVLRPARLLRPRTPVGQEGQAVGEESRADEQDALIAQRLESTTQLDQRVGVVGGQRHLNDGDVGVRVHDLEWDPRSVVETA